MKHRTDKLLYAVKRQIGVGIKRYDIPDLFGGFLTHHGVVFQKSAFSGTQKMCQLHDGAALAFIPHKSILRFTIRTGAHKKREVIAVFGRGAGEMLFANKQSGITSMEDLLAKSPLLQKFRAVQEDHVYCTTKNLYQSTMELGTITSDIHKMLIGDDADLTYLYKLE